MANVPLTLIFFFPLFTLFDWSITAFGISKSHNFLRTFFGFLLGVAYALGLILLITDFPNPVVLSIGAFYVLASIFLIYLKNKIKKV